jgi:hypothetical protein
MGRQSVLLHPLRFSCTLIAVSLITTDLFAWFRSFAECEHGAIKGSRVRVVVLSDPQLTDRTSYDFLPPGPLLSAVMLLSDAYMARSFDPPLAHNLEI